MTKEEEQKILDGTNIFLKFADHEISMKRCKESLDKLVDVFKLGIGTDKDNNYYLLGLEGDERKVYYRFSQDFSNYQTEMSWKETKPVLTSLDLSNWDTSNVTSMSWMFAGCKNLKSLDLSNFDTSKVADMSAMFHECEKLESLDLSNFNTSRVADMSSMFVDCKNLTSIKLSNFDTSNVRDMSNMFYGCESLTFIDLSSFDTSRVTDMRFMFNDCYSLVHLDLSNFYTGNVTDMHFIFSGCENLSYIEIDESKNRKLCGWDPEHIEIIAPTEQPPTQSKSDSTSEIRMF